LLPLACDATLVSVGGQRGWPHADWPWRFRMCSDAAEEPCLGR
jgi:hypothetical protein